MRKVKLCVGLLALLTSATAAIAFNRRSSSQQLYYYNSHKACVAAPCETANKTGKACQVAVYTDDDCKNLYSEPVYTSEGD